MFTILLVDDDAQIRSLLASFLSRCGLGLTVQAADGAEALSSLSAIPADLVITDCQMPTMDGISFVKALRSRGHHMPVIMLSGQGDPRVVQIALKAGVDRYLEKPTSPPELLALIRQLTLESGAKAA